MATNNPPDNWTMTTGVWGTDADHTTSHWHVGDSSINLKNTAVAAKLTSGDAPLEAGPQTGVNGPMVLVTCAARADSIAAGRTVTVAAEQRTADKGTVVGTVYPINGLLNAANTWERKSALLSASSSAHWLRLYVAKAAQAFNAWIDALEVRQCPRYAHAFRTSSQSINDSTTTNVLYNSTSKQGVEVDGTTGQIDIQEAGIYRVSFTGNLESLADGTQAYARLVLNGSTVILAGPYGRNGGAGDMGVTLEWTGILSQDDYLHVQVAHNYGSARNLSGDAGGTLTRMSIVQCI